MFSQQFSITIRDINYGQHLDHLALLEYLHETRFRYFKSIGCTENNVDGNGNSLIVSNLSCSYKSECFYGDVIKIQLDLHKQSEFRLIFKYLVTKDDKTVAIAEITTAFINLRRKLVKIPNNLLTKFKAE